MSEDMTDSSSIGYDSDTFSLPPYKLGYLAEYATAALENAGYELQLSKDGEGGTYFVTQKGGIPIAVFKPAEEEIGCNHNPRGHTEPVTDREGFQLGQGHKREVLAYLLDYDHFSSVPETVAMTVNGRPGSMQRFIPGMDQSWDFTPGKFSKESVQRIAIFDLRTMNADRHGGNILVRPGDPMILVPIDHSYILPEGFADPDFEWMDWSQAKAPIGPEELEYIAALNPDEDQALVTRVLGEEAGEIIGLTTRLLKLAAARGYTLHEIAHFFRREMLTQPSGLEALVAQCRLDLDKGGMIDFSQAQLAMHTLFPVREKRSRGEKGK